MLSPEQATVGALVKVVGQERSGILGGAPVVLSVISIDELPSNGKVTCGWFDNDIHWQQNAFPVAVLALKDD